LALAGAATGSRKSYLQLPLLSNVNFFFLVDVSEKINQTANESDYGEAQGLPEVTVATFRFYEGYKLVEVVDRPSRSRQPDEYGQYVFNAFHFEPPANELL
jgi:hypothetical protein